MAQRCQASLALTFFSFLIWLENPMEMIIPDDDSQWFRNRGDRGRDVWCQASLALPHNIPQWFRLQIVEKNPRGHTGWCHFPIILRNSASIFHWLSSSSIFNVRSFVVCPASVTPPLISTIWCFRSYKPYIFCEDMILATCQCHSLLSWAQFTVV